MSTSISSNNQVLRYNSDIRLKAWTWEGLQHYNCNNNCCFSDICLWLECLSILKCSLGQLNTHTQICIIMCRYTCEVISGRHKIQYIQNKLSKYKLFSKWFSVFKLFFKRPKIPQMVKILVKCIPPLWHYLNNVFHYYCYLTPRDLIGTAKMKQTWSSLYFCDFLMTFS